MHGSSQNSGRGVSISGDMILDMTGFELITSRDSHKDHGIPCLAETNKYHSDGLQLSHCSGLMLANYSSD